MAKLRVIDETTELVKIPLTTEEWIERAQQMGALQGQVEDLAIQEGKLKDSAKALKEKREDLLAQALELGRAIRERAEERRDDVQLVANFDEDKAQTIIKRTGQVIRERDRLDTERQTVLEFAPAKAR